MRNVFVGLAVLGASALLAAACSGGGNGGEPTAASEITAVATVTIGDTVTGVPGSDPAPFSMMLLSCLETSIAVYGPYNDSYDTFTAKPGMKFLIIEYRLTNTDVRQQDAPLINGGDVRTAPNGYLYFAWSPPPLGVQAAKYAPRRATQEELDRLGSDAGAYKTLVPGESVTGRIVFEMPTDARPLEADLAYVPAKIAPDGQCRR